MQLKEMGEEGFIDRLRQRTRTGKGVYVGIGDDAAVLKRGSRYFDLFTTDMLVEGVHFKVGERDAAGIGHKALSVNVSDIAAMGGTPSYAVVSLGAPARTSVAFLEKLYGGMEAFARKTGVVLVGGDTVRARRLVISVALLGLCYPKHLVLRKGAHPGDDLWITGCVGKNLDGRDLRVVPRIKESGVLVKHFKPKAMMDLSDGLWTDLKKLCKASGVGAMIDLDQIPIHSRTRQRAKRTASDPMQIAFTAGEDFELLFTLSRETSRRLQKNWKRYSQTPVTKIGKVVRGKSKITIYGHHKIKKIKDWKGWKHF